MIPVGNYKQDDLQEFKRIILTFHLEALYNAEGIKSEYPGYDRGGQPGFSLPVDRLAENASTLKGFDGVGHHQ